MSQLFNIYCDESCHLESSSIVDENRFMVLGGIACSSGKKDEVFKRIKGIKKDNGFGQFSEMKWKKVSMGKLDAYKDLINYFFDCSDLYFRAVVVDKKKLNYNTHNHSND